MGKINMTNKAKGSFKDFLKNLFSSKKNIIITSIVLAVVVLSAILVPIIIKIVKDKNAPKPPQIITITFNVATDNQNALSGVEVYLNSTNAKLTTSSQGSFSINSQTNSFAKGDVLRIQRQGYDLKLNIPPTTDLMVDGSNIILVVTNTQTINIVATKKISAEEEKLKTSLSLNFVDQNGTKINTQIKAMEKSTIPTDLDNKPDYYSEDINILGTTSTGNMLIEIDENQEIDIVIYLFSEQFDFEDVSFNKTHQNQKMTLVGKVKQKILTNGTLEGLRVYLRYPNNNFVTDKNAVINYSYVNIYNNANSIVMDSITVTDDNVAFLDIDENTMFESLVFNVKINGRYFWGKCYPSGVSSNINVILKEGYLVQAKYGYNRYVEIIDNKDNSKMIVRCDYDNGICEFVTDTLDLTFKKSGTDDELFLVKMNNGTKEEINSLNQNIIYDAQTNQVVLSSTKN